MKKIYLLFLLLITGFSSMVTIADTFDPETNTLTMDSVIVGDREYFNVVIRIDQFTVLGVGSSMLVNSGLDESCGPGNFTIDKYNAIQVGMSLEQINQVIGCKSDPGNIVRTSGLEVHRWEYINSPDIRLISVTFDQSTQTVTGTLGNSFKSSSGF